MFWYVIPFGKSFDEFWFTYEIPKNFEKDIKIGQIVKIFLWEKETFWVIYEIFEDIPEKIEKSKIKKIEEITNQKSFIKRYSDFTLSGILGTMLCLARDWCYKVKAHGKRYLSLR